MGRRIREEGIRHASHGLGAEPAAPRTPASLDAAQTWVSLEDDGDIPQGHRDVKPAERVARARRTTMETALASPPLPPSQEQPGYPWIKRTRLLRGVT